MNKPNTSASVDLNLSEIQDDGIGGGPISDPAIRATSEVHAVFRHIKQHALRFINARDTHVMVGCIAWLTDPDILDALARKEGVAIVVQKEDFLRPDADAHPLSFKSRLRRQYKAMPSTLGRFDRGIGVLHGMSYCIADEIEPVRCVGNHNRDRSPAMPRAHHKFLIGCRVTRDKYKHEFGEGEARTIHPVRVWTGSYNFTINGGRSLENAVIINNAQIAQAYLEEWAQVEALSEPLDWRSDWMEPEWRIGS